MLYDKHLLGRASDLINRDYGESGVNFLLERNKWNGDIITNPPFKYAEQFICKAISLSRNKVAMLLRIQFLEGQARQKLFQLYPPRFVYVFSKRLHCALNGNFETTASSNAICFAWFVWYKGYKGEPSVRWL